MAEETLPKETKSSVNKWLVIALSFFVVATIVLGVCLLISNTAKKEGTPQKVAEESAQTSEEGEEEAEKEDEEDTEEIKTDGTTLEQVQSVYHAAYVAINGNKIIDYNKPVTIEMGEKDTFGGVVKTEAYELKTNNLGNYFTSRAIKYIKTYFTHTPNGHKDGKYYIIADTENTYFYDIKEFMNTVFGSTDSSERKLSIVANSDDLILAVSKKSSSMKQDEYMIFKKVDGSWKIDMFEEF